MNTQAASTDTPYFDLGPLPRDNRKLAYIDRIGGLLTGERFGAYRRRQSMIMLSDESELDIAFLWNATGSGRVRSYPLADMPDLIGPLYHIFGIRRASRLLYKNA